MIGLWMIGFGLAISMVDGYVLSRLWSYFVVPYFQAPPMPPGIAIGLGLLWALMRKKAPDKETSEKTPKQIINDQFVSLAVTMIFWLEGYVVYRWLVR